MKRIDELQREIGKQVTVATRLNAVTELAARISTIQLLRQDAIEAGRQAQAKWSGSLARLHPRAILELQDEAAKQTRLVGICDQQINQLKGDHADAVTLLERAQAWWRGLQSEIDQRERVIAANTKTLNDRISPPNKNERALYSSTNARMQEEILVIREMLQTKETSPAQGGRVAPGSSFMVGPDTTGAKVGMLP